MHHQDATLIIRYHGEIATVRKRVVHQWRTDIILEVRGREFLIGRMESRMTRREVRELAIAWLDARAERWRYPNVARLSRR